MNKFYIPLLVSAIMQAAMYAQSPTDAYSLSQSDLKGTARFMSMAGAFGALGGDLSSLSQNPAGIGIYRSNELGITFDISAISSETSGAGAKFTDNMTKFNVNNVGGVATLKLNSSVMPNVNIGFTYNKAADFRRRYSGTVNDLQSSLGNYIAGVANAYGLTESDLHADGSYDPYNTSNVPWLATLGYDSYLITPENSENPYWLGQYEKGVTSGFGSYSIEESGSVDEYNIVLGGNISNKVYWGMNFDIVSLNYKMTSIWSENLTDAYVYNDEAGEEQKTWSNYSLKNKYRISGTGFNYQLGLIYKPMQELRLGLAFHTPTYYTLNETFDCAQINYESGCQSGYAITNNGTPSYNDVNFQSPWRVIASAAGVIGNSLIVSADYEWQGYKNMEYSEPTYGYDYWYDDYYNYWDTPWYSKGNKEPFKTPAATTDVYSVSNSYIKTIYRNTNTLRIGAEYRIIPQFSVRLGYSYVSSPVTSKAKDCLEEIPSTGAMTSYRLDNSTNYATCGVGYRQKGFYADLAYVYKHMSSTYYPFSPDPANVGQTILATTPKSNVKFDTHQMVLSVGYKF